MQEFLLAVLAYVVREGVPLLMQGTQGGKPAEFAPVRYVPATEKVLPYCVGERKWYPDTDRIIFWVDSGDHTYENRKVMVVAWDPVEDDANFEQVAETMVRFYKDVAAKVYCDDAIPHEVVVHVPRDRGTDPDEGWAEEVVL